MKATERDRLNDFSRESFESDGMTFDVFVSNDGETPLVFLHEIPEISPQQAEIAREFVARGFKVWMPSFLGDPGAVGPGPFGEAEVLVEVCVRREFTALMGDSTRPVVTWIRSLARKASSVAGGGKVGVIGMCFTGGFALAAATDGSISGSVACQPAIPFTGAHNEIDIGKDDFDTLRARTSAGDLALRGYRFVGDGISRCERFQHIDNELGAQFQGRCLPDECADGWSPHAKAPHSVITIGLIDEAGQPTREALDEIHAFFEWRLRGAPAPPAPTSAAPLRDCARFGCARKIW